MPITESDILNYSKDADNYLKVWKKLWSVRDTAWHLEHRNPMLKKYDELIVDQNTGQRMLFPLCGKNVDMKWYWENGFDVIGVECADEAINDFFTGNNIMFTSTTDESINGKIFKTTDEKLKIIQSNFLTLNSPLLINTINAVWDRGSFGTITYEEQVLYVQTMRRLLAPNFRYLLLVLEFDDTLFDELPYSITYDRINELMGDFANIKKLESHLPEHLELYQKHMKQDIEVRETVYLLTDKRSMI